MKTSQPEKNIAQVFEEFLADQKSRISAKTLSKYQSIIQLYESYLESYWPGHDGEYGKTGGKYCGTYGPEEITAGYSEFLGYFMPRKVMCGKDLMQAAGTVTKKLAKWLAEKGYAEDTAEEQDQAANAARDLPNAQTVADLLCAYVDQTAPDEKGKVIEDHFWIEKIEPGKIWLQPLMSDRTIGPIPVPERVTKLCKTMWDIGGVVAKTSQGWRFVEVWNVSPR